MCFKEENVKIRKSYKFFKGNMPVTKSAWKALRKDQRRTKVNQAIRIKMKAAVKKAQLKPTLINLKLASQLLDRAAKKKVIHQNKAARLKSRLSKLGKKRK